MWFATTGRAVVTAAVETCAASAVYTRVAVS